MFVDREEIDKLLNDGYTIAEICKYYQEKGIDVKYDRLYHCFPEASMQKKSRDPFLSAFHLEK